MKYFESSKRVRGLIPSTWAKWLVLIFLMAAGGAVSGCDFINQVANLGNNVGDMIGKGIGGG